MLTFSYYEKVLCILIDDTLTFHYEKLHCVLIDDTLTFKDHVYMCVKKTCHVFVI